VKPAKFLPEKVKEIEQPAAPTYEPDDIGAANTSRGATMRTTTKYMIIGAIAGAAASALLVLGADTAQAFNPQPDPPSTSQHAGQSGIGNPNDRVALGGPDTKTGSLGGPDTKLNMGPGVKVSIGNPNDFSHIGDSTAGVK
jgi:hypothetical protein